jgi:hypothetical protein
LKKFVGLGVPVIAVVYGTGAVALSESGANRCVNELEMLSLRGR